MTHANLKSHQRRSETPNTLRDYREAGRLSSSGWSTPLWDHALPAWSAGAKSREAVGYAELTYRREAVRRWRGLPPESAD